MKIFKLNAFIYLSFEGADFCLRQGRKVKECCRIANFSDAVSVKICPSKPYRVWMSSRSAHIHSARICIEVRPSGLYAYFRLLFCYVFLCFIFTSPFNFGYKKTASLKVKRFDEMYLVFCFNH